MTPKQTVIIIATVAMLAILVYANVQFSGTPTPPHVTPTPASSPSQTPYARVLTPDEQQVLHIPLHNASSYEKAQHAQEVARLAQSASFLDISGCKPTPLVYQVNLTGSFHVTNHDPIPHSLRYLTLQITLPAYSTTTIQTSQLFKTTGDYGYGCDNPFAKQGVFMVR